MRHSKFAIGETVEVYRGGNNTVVNPPYQFVIIDIICPLSGHWYAYSEDGDLYHKEEYLRKVTAGARR